MADSELQEKLDRQINLIESNDAESSATEKDPIESSATEKDPGGRPIDGVKSPQTDEVDENKGEASGASGKEAFTPYTEYLGMTPKTLEALEKLFKNFDLDGDKFLNLDEMKHMMEKFGAPKSHFEIEKMIKEVDEDKDGAVSFIEFLAIFRKVKGGEATKGSGLYTLVDLADIDVSNAGVGGAKGFFESKIDEHAYSKKYEDEMIVERGKNVIATAEEKERKKIFQDKKSNFE